jgi:hypothetical protein
LNVTRRWIALLCLAVLLITAAAPGASYVLWLALPVAFFALWAIALAGSFLQSEEPAAPVAMALAVLGSRSPPVR